MAFRPWEYRTETGSAGYEVDLTGYSVAAVDGDFGHVDEAINELLGGSYLLVDTGPVFGRTVMLPAGVVERIDTAEKKIYVDRTKDQINGTERPPAETHEAQRRPASRRERDPGLVDSWDPPLLAGAATRPRLLSVVQHEWVRRERSGFLTR